MKKKILIVGAGFSGATIARTLADTNKYSVNVIDSRNHIGGNAYDYLTKDGFRVHKYGPHIFHTSNEKVFQWLSKYTEWTPYQHKVKALLSDGRYVTLPVNKETKEIVGEENIIDTFFRPYTEKMWGKKLEEISPSVLNRVPIRDDMNELYFPDDIFQYMPSIGYTSIFEKLLDHKNIKVELNALFHKSLEKKYDHIFNSMAIDEYFAYKYGDLPYRSIKFFHQLVPMNRVLPTTTVNFTHTEKYTRVTEWKNFPNSEGCLKNQTLLTFEEPCDYKQNKKERYYPVKDISGENRAIYEKYKAEEPSNVTFIGRCGLYAYLDMHMAINMSLITAEKFIKENMNE